MPSLAKYKTSLGLDGRTLGEVRKSESDKIMEWTWDDDIAQQIAYQFDMYHDPDPRKLDDLKPTKDMIPLDIKFIRHTSQTLDKDAISFHLQMKPSQECNVPYYQKYKDMYGSRWPLGMYVLIRDSKGKYNRWMVVAEADFNDLQFPTWELLRCDYTFQYIIRGQKYEIAGVLQSQNSYNSGIWSDDKTTIVQDQQKFVVPLNRDTEQLYYDLRMIIDAKVLTEPRAWKISKVNRISPNGLVRVTLAQDFFNPNDDYIEVDENGIVQGMWADYLKDIEPTEHEVIPQPTNLYSKITYSGNQNPEVKVGGSYKTYTVKFYNDEGEVDFKYGHWTYEINGKDVSELLNYSAPTPNTVKVKLTQSCEEFIGEDLVISYISNDGIKSSVTMNIIGL